ncbi:hypothetical protein [Parasphingorhabdus sp.]|uniref:hypothetical protein n=1 Tax=Parasphingorhabdus sp. TaxID=2709688 RepID=UPI003D28970B
MDDIEPESSRVANLTVKQRECLDLVILRKSSHEIAHILDISKPAVDQRLLCARRVLGASTREEAASIYGKASGAHDPILYDPVGVPFEHAFGPEGLKDERSSSSMFEEVAMPYDSGIEHDVYGWPQMLRDSEGDWGTAQKIVIMAILIIGVLASILIGLSVSQSLSSLLTA